MGLLQDLRNTSRLGLLVAVAAATVGVIYGYDSSNIAGALLFMTKDFGLSTGDTSLVREITDTVQRGHPGEVAPGAAAPET